MKNLILVILVMCSISDFVYTQSLTQASISTGLSTSLGLGYTGFNSGDLESSFFGGLGFSVSAEYGFTEKIHAFANFEYAPKVKGNEFVESFPIKQIEAGARFLFGSTASQIRPVAQVSISNHSINLQNINSGRWQYNGFAAGVGGGIYYYIRPELALTGMVKIDFGSYTSVTLNEIHLEEDPSGFNTARIFIGICYNFSGS